MKRASLWLIGLIVMAAVAACGVAPPLRSAYTASGDGTRPQDLARTDIFRADDDLNVVVELNTHSRTLEISAIFTAPTGEQYATDTLKADETVGEVVLGLDWEAQGTVTWPPGEWQVDVYIDDTLEKTLHFTVEAAPLPEDGG